MVKIEILNKEELTNLIYGKNGVPILKDLEKRIRFFNYHEDLLNPNKNGEVYFITLFDNKKIIGISKLYKSPYRKNTFWINYFSIDEKYRGKQYSKLMLEKIIEFAKKENIDLESSGYTFMGWDRIRKNLHDLCEKNGVVLIDDRNQPEFESEIKKFSDFINESLRDKMKPKSEEEIFKELGDLTPNELLVKSAKNDFFAGVKKALNNGADINVEINEETAIECAVYNNNYDMTKFLLDNGANVNQEFYYKENLLISAVKRENINIVKLLIDYDVNLFYISGQGKTALDVSYHSEKRKEITDLLIYHMNISKTNEDVNNDFINKQILDYCENNNIEVREMDGEKYIHLYHGTNIPNYKKILKSGKFLSGTWFAGDLETAKQYGNMATRKCESVVLTQYININSLYFNGYFIAKHDLKMNYKYGSGGNVYESVNENIKADMKLPQDILTFYELFKKANKDLFLVGGSVRDFIMGKTPHDFDLVTNALPDETKEILKDYRTDLQGVHFGVIRVFTENEPLGYEVASYRKDLVTGRDTKGDDQKVEIGKHITIKDDVLRRDYSCNALFYDIGKKEIIDLVGGIEDIKNNIIRAVGNPEERFKEDKLRIIRGIRFAARTHSKIDEETANAIRKDKRLRGISPKDDVSQERIIEEIKKAWEYCYSKNDLKAWQTYFKLLNEFDLLEEMFPNVKLNKDVEYIETLTLPITYATLFEDNEPTPEFEKTLIRIFKLSNKISDVIMFLLTFMRDAGDVEKVYILKKKQLQYNISDDIIREYSYMNGIGKRFTDKFLEYKLTVSGEDVMSDGFKGSEIGIEQKRRELEIFNNLLNENYNF